MGSTKCLSYLLRDDCVCAGMPRRKEPFKNERFFEKFSFNFVNYKNLINLLLK